MSAPTQFKRHNYQSDRHYHNQQYQQYPPDRGMPPPRDQRAGNFPFQHDNYSNNQQYQGRQNRFAGQLNQGRDMQGQQNPFDLLQKRDRPNTSVKFANNIWVNV